MDRREALEHAKLADIDRMRPADPREIVAQQIDDHHVLRPILLAAQQGLGLVAVLLGRRPPGPGSLDRAGLDPTVGQFQKPFR